MNQLDRKHKKIWLLVFSLFLLLFVSSRMVILFYSSGIYHDEEEFRGTVAKELIEGSRLSLFDYQYTAYEGGSLLACLLIVPFYMLLGVNIYSLKLAGLLIAICSFAIIWYLLNRYGGTRPAIYGAWIMILAPPYFIKRNLMIMGDFDLSMLATLVVLLAFCRIYLEKKFGWKSLALFGFACGLSTWIHYSSFVMVAVCSFLLIYRLREIKLSGVLSAMGGALVGIWPLIYYNIVYRKAGEFRLLEGISYTGSWPEILQHFINKYIQLVSYQIAMSYQFTDVGPLSGKLLSLSYYGLATFCFFVILIYAIYRYRKTEGQLRDKLALGLIGCLYIEIYSLVYAASKYKYTIGWDILTPQSASYLYHLFTTLFIVFPIGLDLLIGNKRRRPNPILIKLGKAVFLATMAIGFIGFTSLIDSNPNDQDRFIGQPHSMNHLAFMLGENFFKSPQRAEKVFKKLSPAERLLFARGHGYKRGNNMLQEVPAYYTAEERSEYIIGYGQSYFTDVIVRDQLVDKLESHLKVWSPIDQLYYKEGIFNGLLAHPNPETIPPEFFEDLMVPQGEIAQFHDQLEKGLGLDFFNEQRSFVASQVRTEIKDGFQIEYILLDLPNDLRLPVNLYRPLNADGPLPTVLVFHSHDEGGKAQYGVQAVCQTLARNGFIAVSYDQTGYGERVDSGHEPEGVLFLQLGLSLHGLEIWEARLLLDYLVTRPDVDEYRIGCTGFSGGGAIALYLTALDTRVKVCVPVAGLTSMAMMHRMAASHFWVNFFNGMATWFDFGDLIGLVAPRPLRVVAGRYDDVFNYEGVNRTVAKGRLYYNSQYANSLENIDLVSLDIPHEFRPETRVYIYDWLSRHLSDGAQIVESDVIAAGEQDLACQADPKQVHLHELLQGYVPRLREKGPRKEDWTKRRNDAQSDMVQSIMQQPTGLNPCDLMIDTELADRMVAELVQPHREPDRQALVILVGRMQPEQLKEKAREIAARGYTVWAVQPLTDPQEIEEEYYLAKRRVMDNTSRIQSQAKLIVSAACATDNRSELRFPNIYLWAMGWDCMPTAIAASLAQRFRGVILEWGPTSLAEQVYYPFRPMDTYYSIYTYPNAFPRMDLVDFLLPFAPQDIYLAKTFIADVPEIRSMFDENVRDLKAAYREIGDADRVTVGSGDFEEILRALDSWH